MRETSGPQRGEARPRVELLPEDRPAVDPHGPTGSVQEADVVLSADLLEKLWRPSYLERLAAAYWRYLRRISLGMLRVVYRPDGRAVTLIHRRLVLLRFRAPRYDTGPGFGQVTWPIERGLLVSLPGRGHLRISVRRLESRPTDGPDLARVRVRSEVQNFYPLLRGQGRFARLGARLYSATQLRIHVLVTRGFLRSLARLDLPPSSVGVLAEDGEDEASRLP
jgi:hypothetical protein